MNRNKMIDICKAIGIISIVMGHSSWSISVGEADIQVGPFVYLYHLAIFFFCSGYLFKEEAMGVFLAKKIKALYLPFVTYSFLYFLLRPLFISCGLVDGQPYTLQQYVITLSDVLMFNGGIEFLSAFWFLPMMFAAMCVYAFVFWVSKKITLKYYDVLRLAFCVLIGIVGLYTTSNNCGMLHNLQISYLMVFVVELGYWYKKVEHVIQRFCGVITMLLSATIMVWIIRSDIGIIELSKFMIISKKLFYPVTVIGILFCISLSKILEKNRYVCRVMTYIGQNSLDIMALHFFAIKVCDWIYSFILNDFSNLRAFPYSYPQLWPVYYVWGVGFPLLVVFGFKKAKNKIVAYLKKHKVEN